ncbi:glycosyltransferase [Tamlana sp. I1]|uniref:glycosyltransferase n=1 Tax=Tamlana sp. I1 TaxID=2762061 RepID=UPI00188E9E39|nr:glycosyltransferase [Tamlana sp. I1]
MIKRIKLAYRNYKLKFKLRKRKVFFDFNSIEYGAKNILIIDSKIPNYNEDSGSRRLYEIIKILLDQDFSIFLLADLNEYKYENRYAEEYIEEYKSIGVKVYQPSLDIKGDLITKERFISEVCPFINYAWLHRPEIFNSYYITIKSLNKNVILIYDMVDFHYLRLIREWKLNNKSKVKLSADKILNLEIANCKAADKIIVISDNDKLSLEKYYLKPSKMTTIGNLHEFRERPNTFKIFSERKNLLFIGGFSHQPNVDAVLWLKNEIMPLIWAVDKDIKIDIIGSNIPKKILSLKTENFNVIGFVEDLSVYFNSAKIFIAPLKYGAGIKGKIGQSFEFSLPVITTDIGAEGFDLSPFSEEMIANTSELLASKILKLYNDQDLWRAISNRSEQFITPFTKQHIENQLKKVFNLKKSHYN